MSNVADMIQTASVKKNGKYPTNELAFRSLLMYVANLAYLSWGPAKGIIYPAMERFIIENCNYYE